MKKKTIRHYLRLDFNDKSEADAVKKSIYAGDTVKMTLSEGRIIISLPYAGPEDSDETIGNANPSTGTEETH